MTIAENTETADPSHPPKERLVRLGWLWSEIKQRRRAALFVALITLVSPAINLLLPLRIRSRTEDILNSAPLEVLAGELLIVLAIVFASLTITALRRFLMSKLCLGIVTDIRDQLYRHILSLSPKDLKQTEDGRITNAFTYDLDLLHVTLKRMLGTLLPSGFLATIYTCALFWFSWQLALALIGIFLPMILLTNGFVGRIHNRAKGAQARQGELLGELAETMSGPKEIKLFRLEPQFARRFAARNQQAYQETVKRDFLAELHPFLLSMLVAIAIAAVIMLAALFIARGWISPGDLAGFLICLGLLYPQVQEISHALGQAVQIFAARERIDAVLELPPEADVGPKDGPGVADGSISMRGVHFTHEGGSPAIRDLDLEIANGDRVAIVGPSGAGKSTLLELLPRFNEIDAGRIEVGGTGIDEVALSHLRTQVGLVLQVPFLFRGTLRENLVAGQTGVTEERLRVAAKQARVDEFVGRLPNGYDSEIEPGGANLSVGQRQRIAIARVLLRDPPILLLDEPTSALDVASETHVGEAIRAASRGRTTIIVAHRLSTVRDADRIIVMDAGRIVEDGNHETLVAQGGIYAGLYAQFEGSQKAKTQ